MKKGIIIFVTHTTIGALGFFCGYFLTKKKYENLIEEEVESVKSSFAKHYSKGEDDPKAEEPVDDKKKYRATIDNFEKDTLSQVPPRTLKEYKNYTNSYVNKDDPLESDKIYLIDPSDYNMSEYESETLVYYADDVLTDDNYMIVDKRSEYLGNILRPFKSYSKDTIVTGLYIRNDILKIDYEIIFDNREFSKVAPKYAKNYPETMNSDD